MSPRNIFRIGLVVAALGWFGWNWYHAHRASDAPDKPVTTKPVATKAADAPPAKARMYGAIAFHPCTLAPQYGAMSVEAQCGTLSVPEDRAQPNGRKLSLAIAWVPAADNGEVADDPVFLLAGGPGQSARDSYPQVASAFADVLKHRNVVLVDQRGTGGSNLLSCDNGDEDDTDASTAAAVAMAERCIAELSKKADLRRYTTTDAVADLEAVRKALGVAQLNLIGVSYGTRVAQQYAMRHPASTRSIVLDSVVPNALGLGNIFARNLDDALALQFAQCTETPACKARVGEPRAELSKLMATLRANPPTVRYRDAGTGEWREDTLSPDRIAGMVRMYAYMPVIATLLPVLIHDANEGHYENLAALSRMMQGEMKDAMAMGMQMSVVCSEDAASMVARKEDADTLLGNGMTEAMAAICKVWPKGGMPADFHKPLATAVPALVLEGEFDPVTPPRYGKDVVKSLENGRLLVLRGQGHNVIGAGCMPKLFAQFVQDANAKSLDAKCLDSLAYAQPFTSFNGWQP
jgi:pimeloyl-ACP methyl ester carboxylesterase